MIDIFIARVIGLNVPCRIKLSYDCYTFTICAFDNPRINALWSEIYRNLQSYLDIDNLPDLIIERGEGYQSYIVCEIEEDELPQKEDLLESYKDIIFPILLYFQFLFAGKFYVDRIIFFKNQDFDLIPHTINLYTPQNLFIADDPLLFARESDSIEPNMIRGIEDNFNTFYDSIQNNPQYLNLIHEYLDAIISQDYKLRLAYLWNSFEHMIILFMKQRGGALLIQDDLYQKIIKMIHEKLNKELTDADVYFEGLEIGQIVSALEQPLFKIYGKAKGVSKEKIKEIRDNIRKIMEDYSKDPPILSKEKAIEEILRCFNNYPSIRLLWEKVFTFFAESSKGENECDFLFTLDNEMILRKPGPVLEGYSIKIRDIIMRVKKFRNNLFHEGEVSEDIFEINQLTKCFKIISLQLLLNLLNFIKPFQITDFGLIWNTPEAKYYSVEDTITKKLEYAMRVETGPIIQARMMFEELEEIIFNGKILKFQELGERHTFRRGMIGELVNYDKDDVLVSLKTNFEGILLMREGRLYIPDMKSDFMWRTTILLKENDEIQNEWSLTLDISKRRFTFLNPGKVYKFKTNKMRLIHL